MQVEKVYPTATATASPATAVTTTTTMAPVIQTQAPSSPCGCSGAKTEGDKLVKRVNLGITLFHIVLILAIILFVRKIFE